MTAQETVYTAGMDDRQRSWFYTEYYRVHRDEVAGILLAVFLGSFGAHHFYLRRYGIGVLYLLFSWTGVPSILGWIEAFFMPGRVRRFNIAEAMAITMHVRRYGYMQETVAAF